MQECRDVSTMTVLQCPVLQQLRSCLVLSRALPIMGFFNYLGDLCQDGGRGHTRSLGFCLLRGRHVPRVQKALKVLFPPPEKSHSRLEVVRSRLACLRTLRPVLSLWIVPQNFFEANQKSLSLALLTPPVPQIYSSTATAAVFLARYICLLILEYLEPTRL